jgi:hypothetical protein
MNYAYEQLDAEARAIDRDIVDAEQHASRRNAHRRSVASRCSRRTTAGSWTTTYPSEEEAT